MTPVLTIRRTAFDMRDEPVELRVSTVNTAAHGISPNCCNAR